ncbi:ABC transporter substrate-binding protein [Bifidobacterium moraviense]|nr:extracellular solute-binding protein [Bifidobacterium sp. DSM 109958]
MNAQSAIRKAAAIVACAATLVTMGACGGSSGGSANSSDKHLTISWWGNQQRNDNMAKANALFEQANEGVTIDGQFFDSGSYYKKLSTQAAGGSLPDIIQIGGAELSQYYANGLLVDLTDYVKNGTLDLSDADANLLEAGQFEGKQIGIPTAVATPALIYDKTITDKAGVTIPNDMTPEQFVEISRTIYEKTGVKTNFAYGAGYEILQTMMRGDGKDLFKDGKLGVTADDMEYYFRIFETGIKEGWHIDAAAFAELTLNTVEQDPLVYGTDPSRQSWCAFLTSSQISAADKVARADQNLQLAPWPSHDVSKSTSLNYAQQWVVSKDCKNPELAAKWISWFTNDLESNKIRLTDRGIPISSKIVEEITPLLTASDQKSADYILNVVTPISAPPIALDPGNASQLKAQTLPQIEEALCYGTIDAKQAAQQFYDEATTILAK